MTHISVPECHFWSYNVSQSQSQIKKAELCNFGSIKQNLQDPTLEGPPNKALTLGPELYNTLTTEYVCHPRLSLRFGIFGKEKRTKLLHIHNCM